MTAQAQRIIDRLLGSPVGRAATAEEVAHRLARRRAAVAEIACLDADLERSLPALLAAEEAAKAEAEAASLAFRHAEQNHRAAHAALSNASGARDRGVDTQRVILRGLAPASIDDLLTDLSGVDRAKLRERFMPDPRPIGRDQAGRMVVGVPVAEAHEASERMAALLEGLVRDAEALKFAALGDEEIETEIGRLRARLQDAGRAETVGAR